MEVSFATINILKMLPVTGFQGWATMWLCAVFFMFILLESIRRIVSVGYSFIK